MKNMIKKLSVVVLAAVVLLSLLPNKAMASEAITLTGSSSFAGHVSEESELISPLEVDSLNDLAKEVSNRHNCEVYILVVDDFTTSGKSDIYDFAQDVYGRQGLGYGSDHCGVMLTLSMEDRDYNILAHGDYANMAFTDYGKDLLSEVFLDDFRNGNWYQGFYDFINECDSMMQLADEGNPVDVPPAKKAPVPVKVAGSAVLASIFALFSANGQVNSLKRGMKTAKKATRATEYIGSVNLRVKDDVFVNRIVTRTPIERSSGGKSNGGTTVNSGGFSGKSGKF